MNTSKKRQIDTLEMVDGTSISSNESASYLGTAIMGVLFAAPPLLIFYWANNLETILLVILSIFLCIATALLLVAKINKDNYDYYGPTPLLINPKAIKLGEKISGQLDLSFPVQEQAFKIKLRCLHRYSETKLGKSQDHTEVLWQQEKSINNTEKNKASHLQFSFDIPNIPSLNKPHTLPGHVFWIVSASGVIMGNDFNRSWDIAINNDNKHQCEKKDIKTSSFNSTSTVINYPGEEQANEDIQINKKNDDLSIISEQRLGFSLVFIILGAMFSGFIMLSPDTDASDILTSTISSIITLLAELLLIYGVFSFGKGLVCKITHSEIQISRTFFGVPIHTRIAPLIIKNNVSISFSSRHIQNQTNIDFYKVVALINDKGSKKKIVLVENIKGELAAKAVKQLICESLPTY